MNGVRELDNILYTVKEVTIILKTNVDYVHKLRSARLLPFLKLGQYKVRKEALAEFLCRYEGKDLTDPFQIRNYENEKVDKFFYFKRSGL